MKISRILFPIILLVAALFSLKATAAIVVPDDLPTIEALISLHKSVKAEEDKANVQLSLSYMEQMDNTKKSVNFNDVRKTLDTKISNAYSYVILATALSTTALSIYKLMDEYRDFTTTTAETVTKKPFVAFYYTNAQLAVAKEIKHAKKLYVAIAASGVNIMKASMDEKLSLIFSLQDCIEKARHIIRQGRIYCDLMISGGWQPCYIEEIMNSEIKDAIVNGIVTQWKTAK